MKNVQTTIIGQQLLHYCTERDLRYTQHRVLIAEKLADAGRPLTAEELFLLLKRDNYGISICSVYSNLKLLVNWGFAQAVQKPKRITCYQLITA